MKIAKTREVKSPQRGTSLSAGIDFFVPRFDEEFVMNFFEKNSNYGFTIQETFDKLQMIVKPHHKVLIPSGIKVNFEGKPKALIAFNKSGVSVKKGLDVLACVIDQDYQGEIHLSLVNTGEKDVIVFQDEKIVQFIIIPIEYEDIEEVSENELWTSETERGEGGFGSTNK
jgi:dUTP pyrophosphatase